MTPNRHITFLSGVAADDKARRQIQRDLHDGAQASLVRTVITLKLALRTLGDHDSEARKLVDDALGHAVRANKDLRDLAHGVLPKVLASGGLRAGVESLTDRVPHPVAVDVLEQGLPSSLEATAYFITAEALTNVVKHAEANRAEVHAALEGDVLRLEVCDDGVGGATVDGGSGLLGLRDRAKAAGGKLDLASPPGGGTVVTAKLPLGPDPSDGVRSSRA